MGLKWLAPAHRMVTSYSKLHSFCERAFIKMQGLITPCMDSEATNGEGFWKQK